MIGDTIQAVASPRGPSERGIVRISGPEARAAASSVFAPELPSERAAVAGHVTVLGRRVPALALVMIAPRSYTGEDVVELHVPGSPLLLALLGEDLVPRARPALPGEFTRRAFENGRMDLAAAEGVLQLVHAATDRERRRALHMLRGGLAAHIDVARSALQDALALLESGLDFTEGETGAVPPEQAQQALERASRELEELARQWPAAPDGGAVLLLGAANAGKSALANALAGRDEALVSDHAGTTRDLLRIELTPDVVLWDGPGDLEQGEPADRQALAHRDRLAGEASAVILVGDCAAPWLPPTDLPVLAVAWTKCDLAPPPDAVDHATPGVPRFAVSALTGEGLDELRAFLLDRGGGGPADRGDSVRAHVQTAAEGCRRAADGRAAGAPDEVVAAELAGALTALDLVHGSSSPEDLLDRVFARFCLGK